MTRMFKTGTSVRVIDDSGQDSAIPEEHQLVCGDVRLVEDVSPHGWLRVYGSPAYWIPQRFEQADPEPRKTPKLDALMAEAETAHQREWAVGQNVNAGDYSYLPVGTAVEVPEIGTTFTKTAPDAWGKPGSMKTHTDDEMSRAVRTIVSLPEPWLKKGQTVLVYARFAGYGVRSGKPIVEVPTDRGFKEVAYVDPDAVKPTEELPPWTRVEPGGRYAIVRSGPIQHSRHNAAGGWLGTDGEWRTWEQVCKMATRANDPKVLTSDEEKTDAE